MNESNYAKKALPEWQKENPNAVVFRNNTGMAWQGEPEWKIINGQKVLILKNPRPVFFGVGLPKKDKKTGRIKQTGGGDRLGWTKKSICFLLKIKYYGKICEFFIKNCNNCILSKKIAIFTSLEIKTKNGKESADQIKWRKTVLAAGGIAEILQEE
jgi:hypothetical protein